MAHTQDYVPPKDSEFDGWLENLVKYVNAKTGGTQPEWSFIPAARTAELNDRWNEWHTAHETMLGPHTSVDTEQKNEERKKAEAFARQFVQQYLKFDPVTNEDRTAMRLHNSDTAKTPITTQNSRPVIGELKALGGFRVEIPFFDENTPNSRAKPYGCNGCLVCYTVGSEKVSDYTVLAKTKLMTHSPFALPLEPEAEGKFFSCACRWQSETGELGPWSEIHHVVIA